MKYSRQLNSHVNFPSFRQLFKQMEISSSRQIQASRPRWNPFQAIHVFPSSWKQIIFLGNPFQRTNVQKLANPHSFHQAFHGCSFFSNNWSSFLGHFKLLKIQFKSWSISLQYHPPSFILIWSLTYIFISCRFTL